MLMSLPSMKPVSFSPWIKAASLPGYVSEDEPPRKPITFRGSCAPAGDTHAAALPRRVMNSRRRMLVPRSAGRIVSAKARTLIEAEDHCRSAQPMSQSGHSRPRTCQQRFVHVRYALKAKVESAY